MLALVVKELKGLVVDVYGGASPLLPFSDTGGYREQAAPAMLAGKLGSPPTLKYTLQRLWQRTLLAEPSHLTRSCKVL